MSYEQLDIERILQRVGNLRREIDAERPVEKDQLGKALQRLRLEWTYHSNAIEGNSLSYGETRALLLHGVTAQGKPLKDHLDIRGHREALDVLEHFVRDEEPLTLAAIRGLHKVLLGDEPQEITAQTPDGQPTTRTMMPGTFKTMPNNVRTATGEPHYYASPEETPALMQELMEWYREERAEQGTVHPLVFAADFHHRFVAIHPFDDGNGRLGRLLMNLVLMQAGYVPAVVRRENRSAYYGTLAQADAGDLAPLVRFLGDELAVTMRLYLSALRGEPDPDEFDRRLSLLNRQVETIERRAEAGGPPRTLPHLTEVFVRPFLQTISEGIEKVSSLFRSTELFSSYGDTTGEFEKLGIGNKFPTSFALGEWTSFEVMWLLQGYRLQHGTNLSLSCEASASTRKLEISLIVGGIEGRGDTVVFDYKMEPASGKALEAASQVLDALLGAIEGIQRQVEEQNAAGSSPP